MTISDWASLSEDALRDTLTRRAYSGRNSTVALFLPRRGGFVTTNGHDNEQMSTVLYGSVRVVLKGRECLLGVGETLYFPSGAFHSAQALEDSDIFAPVRSGWAQRQDSNPRAS